VHDNLQSSDERKVPSHAASKENVGKYTAPKDDFENNFDKLSKPYHPSSIE